MIKRNILFLAVLTTFSMSMEFEYKTQNKDKTLGILKEINSVVNNEQIKARYYEEGECKPDYIKEGNFCYKEDKLKYGTVGNVILLDKSADSKLNISVYRNKTAEGDSTMEIVDSYPRIVDLKEESVLRLEPFTSGELSCKNDRREYLAYASSDLENTLEGEEKEKSNAVFNYIVVDVPQANHDNLATIDLQDQIEEILEGNFKCENYGEISTEAGKLAVKQKLANEIQIERKDNVLNEGDQISTLGLSHIPVVVDRINQGLNKYITNYTDNKDEVNEPSVIRYRPVSLDLSKNFYYPEGSMNLNKVESHYASGKTTLETYQLEYVGYPNTKEDYYERVGNYIVYKDLGTCETEMEGTNKEATIGKKNKKIKYTVLINYGNILTQYDTTEELNLFDRDDLQKYVVNAYGLDTEAYDDFNNDITYDIKIQRDPANVNVPTGELKNAEIIYPKILPVIQNKEADNACNEFGTVKVEGQFAEASIELYVGDTVRKTKYVGLVSIEGAQAQLNESAEGDDIINTLTSQFNSKVSQYATQINNYINYDFDRTGGAESTVGLANSIDIAFYNENPNDIFTQYSEGASKTQEILDRRLVYSPVTLLFKYHKCN